MNFVINTIVMLLIGFILSNIYNHEIRIKELEQNCQIINMGNEE